VSAEAGEGLDLVASELPQPSEQPAPTSATSPSPALTRRLGIIGVPLDTV
jgi:hypothetical protein